MQCPGCQQDNPAHAKFCLECGEALSEAAEASSETLAVPHSEGERKLVTVLFSDLAGYTAMTERLDPEEVREIMGRVFGNAAQVVAKYNGTIEKYIGDAVMAVFGVPHAELIFLANLGYSFLHVSLVVAAACVGLEAILRIALV